MSATYDFIERSVAFAVERNACVLGLMPQQPRQRARHIARATATIPEPSATTTPSAALPTSPLSLALDLIHDFVLDIHVGSAGGQFVTHARVYESEFGGV